MVLNVTFNNISVVSWRLVLLEEETRVPGWHVCKGTVTQYNFPSDFEMTLRGSHRTTTYAISTYHY
jgi:hypothetical protein